MSFSEKMYVYVWPGKTRHEL